MWIGWFNKTPRGCSWNRVFFNGCLAKRKIFGDDGWTNEKMNKNGPREINVRNEEDTAWAKIEYDEGHDEAWKGHCDAWTGHEWGRSGSRAETRGGVLKFRCSIFKKFERLEIFWWFETRKRKLINLCSSCICSPGHFLFCGICKNPVSFDFYF